ncbi:replicative DNA helicase [Paenibacillus contaminans]|uniref:DNA 5'-3' helicase n=1 Tax=Paenibacillus contaminans TaxID=450362 RepID=A0A329MSF6_9BACL|nr:DnaB-like helicase C-terminal domain-containing protein [Paenibacillus contaminans]RAV22218.1 hypothetical protein DQG23_04505 [Paenibacillus contaminans]
MIDIHTEQIVLGAMACDSECYDIASSELKEEFFTEVEHRKLFDVMLRMSGLAKLTPAMIKTECAGDTGMKIALDSAVASFTNREEFEYHLKRLKELYAKRQFLNIGERLVRMARNEQTTVDELSGVYESVITESYSTEDKDAIIEIKDILVQVFEQLEQRVMNKGKAENGLRLTYTTAQGKTMGLPGLDDTFMGLRGGDLIMICAESGHGKTALALNIARIIAVHKKKRVYYENTEMSKEELVMRVQSAMTGIPLKDLFEGIIEGEQWEAITMAIGMLSEAPLTVSRIPYLTPLKAKSLAKRVKAKHKELDLVIIDYIGRMELEQQKGMQEYQILYRISEYCKSMAVELDVPVIILAQLTEDGKLEGARKMKNACDGLLFFKPLDDKDYEKCPRQANYKLVKAKVRRNSTDKPIYLHFHKPTQLITEVV